MDSPKNQPTPEARLHFLDYWRIIRIRKTVIIAVFLLIAITATVVTFLLPASYASTARIEIKPDSSDIQNMNGQSPNFDYNAYFIQTEFEKIQDQAVLGKVIEALNLNVEWGKKYAGGEPFKTSETMQFLKNRMNLNPVRNTTLIEITVYGEDPKEAAQIANAIARAYHDYRLEQHKQVASGSIKVLEDLYQAEEDQIRAVQTNVDGLRNDLGISDTDPNSLNPSPTYSQEQLRQLHEQLMEGRARYTELNSRLNGLKAVKAASPEKLRDILPGIVSDNELSDLLGKLHEAQQKFVTMTNDYALANPEVIRVQSLMAELNREIDARVDGVMTTLENEVKSKKAALDATAADVAEAVNKDQAEATRGQPYWQEKRRLANQIDLHKILNAKITQEKIDLDLPKTSMVTYIRNAEPGKAPVKPNKTLNIALGLIVGLVVGVGLAFFIEYLDTSVKTIDDVERALQTSVLGVIPQNVGALIDEGPESRHAEAYRVLRTNILFSRKDEKLNTIVVVSAGAGEGKSTTTLNLATVFAQAGQRVLIVDSDLRRPTIHKLLKVSNALGLTNYLLKQNTIAEVIQTSSVPQLDLMASGRLPSTSMGLLSSAQMREMITELKQRYDFVFFDSPPIMGVSDASILASEVDMVVQVIQYRRYPQPMNIRAKQLIEKVGGNLLGIVLNNINMSQDESYYYYSGYYHDYYSHNEDAQPVAAPAKPGDTEIKQKY